MNTKIHKYKYEYKNTQIQIHKCTLQRFTHQQKEKAKKKRGGEGERRSRADRMRPQVLKTTSSILKIFSGLSLPLTFHSVSGLNHSLSHSSTTSPLYRGGHWSPFDCPCRCWFWHLLWSHSHMSSPRLMSCNGSSFTTWWSTNASTSSSSTSTTSTHLHPAHAKPLINPLIHSEIYLSSIFSFPASFCGFATRYDRMSYCYICHLK